MTPCTETRCIKTYSKIDFIVIPFQPDPNIVEAETPQGLIRGHAYSITQVKNVEIQMPNRHGTIPLLRLRNPWGNEAEWNGPWSDQWVLSLHSSTINASKFMLSSSADRSPEWRFIPDHEKEELGLTFDMDGEFWMSFHDFTHHFTQLEICNLNPDSLTTDDISAGKKRWEMSVFEGEWVRGVTAGGCRNFLGETCKYLSNWPNFEAFQLNEKYLAETFCHNPQYRITLESPDDDDDKCTVIIALMQKNRRAQRRMGADCLTIGFAIYHVWEIDIQ